MTPGTRLLATLDRFERDEQGRRLAVLVFDDGQQLVVPSAFLPPGIRAHQVVRVSFEADTAETDRRAAEIQRLQQELFGD